jgi:hypothetical protein
MALQDIYNAIPQSSKAPAGDYVPMRPLRTVIEAVLLVSICISLTIHLFHHRQSWSQAYHEAQEAWTSANKQDWRRSPFAIPDFVLSSSSVDVEGGREKDRGKEGEDEKSIYDLSTNKHLVIDTIPALIDLEVDHSNERAEYIAADHAIDNERDTKGSNAANSGIQKPEDHSKDFIAWEEEPPKRIKC